MLVLSRKQSEKIRIGDMGTVTIVRVRGNVVRLGFEFPKDVNIVRVADPGENTNEPCDSEDAETLGVANFDKPR